MSRRPSIRRVFTCVLAWALVVTFAIPVPVIADPLYAGASGIPSFSINGGGWGHSIGMSQYGAEGFATVAGWDYEQILTHYYQGTTVRTLGSLGHGANPTVKVNVDDKKDARASWTLRACALASESSPDVSNGRMRISDGSRTEYVEPGDSDQYRTFTAASGRIYAEGISGSFASPVTLTSEQGSPPVMLVRDASGPFNTTYIRYRGQLQLSASGSTMTCVNRLPLEDYLLGVVPREMPASWSAQALRVQAVAARSYAWASGLSGTLYCTAASQVYAGHSGADGMHEHTNSNAAVRATAAEVVYHAGTSAIVQAFFSSSSGGRTANIEDVWTGSSPKPYFTGVSDPYDYVHGNSYTSWSRSFTGLTMAAKLLASSYTWAPPGAGSSVWVTSVSVEAGVSGYPKWVTYAFSNGQATTESGWDTRQALGLPSPNFSFGAVPVTRVFGEDRYATAAEIADMAFPGTAPAAVIARGDDFSDALVGSGVAGAAGGPLLLARFDDLTSDTLDQLASLDPAVVYIMGGVQALSGDVDEAVKGLLPDAQVVRIAGTDRYETAAKAADEVVRLGGGGKIVIANGAAWPDAAAASALSWARSYPILLVRQTSIPEATRTRLASMAPADVIVVGGDAVVNSAVRTAAQRLAGGALTQLAGADRYATSAQVARYEVQNEGFSAETLYLATGQAYADALTGGTLAGSEAHPLTLTPRDRIASSTRSLLVEYRSTIGGLGVFGGPNAITNACLDQAQDALD